MRIENVKLPRESGVPPIALTMWIPEGEPKGVVQILHGMAEHISRYDRPARALAGAGYLVAGHDHRGHGPDWPKDKLGWFSEKDGWKKILEDAHKVTGYLSGRFPGTSLILLGHSMGSFLAREYALVWPGELSALILSGTGSYGRPLAMAGSVLAGLTPPDKPAALVDRIAFSGNNKAFAPARTPFDWLSRDEKEVDKYVSDPLCGFTFTGRAFRDFFGGLTRLTDQKRLKVMDPDMPVLFISGDRDPVGAMGAGVREVEKSFLDAGMKRVKCLLYPGARHELFNETNRDEVLKDLIGWLDGIDGGAV